MPSLTDQPPPAIAAQLNALEQVLSQATGAGGVPSKAADRVTIATWNIRELGRFTSKWNAASKDTPKRDLRSLLYIATILSRFDVIAVQELQGYTSAFLELLGYLNHLAGHDRWRGVASDSNRNSEDEPDERLSYIYDSDRLILSGLVGEVVLPESQFKQISPKRLLRQFARTPYAVGFRPRFGAGNEFILVTLHVAWKDAPLREFEVRRVAEWIDMWSQEPQTWDADIITLGDFNIDRIESEAYEPFSELLTIPAAMHEFPRTIFASGKDKHYDQIAWIANGNFSLQFEDCGWFDHETLLRPGYGVGTTSYSFRVSDHYPMWATFSNV